MSILKSTEAIVAFVLLLIATAVVVTVFFVTNNDAVPVASTPEAPVTETEPTDAEEGTVSAPTREATPADVSAGTSKG